MNPADFRLLIHHHDVAYVDEQGTIWLSAGIGRWVQALAPHFRQIGLLFYRSSTKTIKQDTALTASNVTLWDLGKPGYYFDHFSRMRRIRKVAQEAGRQADGLLVRGVTPRHALIWKQAGIDKKAYFLVGDPDDRLEANYSPKFLMKRIFKAYRNMELDRILNSNLVVIANSPEIQGKLAAKLSKPVYYISTNTIRRDEILPSPNTRDNHPRHVLYVGRLDLRKGLRELFTAAALLRCSGMDLNLEIAAEIKQPEFQVLYQLAHELGIAKHVIWRGRVKYGDALFACYRRADLLALPTYTESFPRVLWEAAANYCPIVTTCVGGIPSILKAGETAIMVEPKDPFGLAKAIGILLVDTQFSKKIAENAHRLVQEYAVEANAGRLTKLLAENW